MTFGEKLQLLRKSSGLSQEQLAAQINISRQAISKWESDTAMPDTENVIRLSKLFQVSTDYLLLEECDCMTHGGGQPAPAASIKKANPRLVRLIAGGAASGLSLVILLVLGVLSSVYPCVYSVSPAGVEWTRVYTGLPGFLKTHHLEWFFWLWCAVLAAGVILMAYDRLRPGIEKLKQLIRQCRKL